MKQQKLVIVYLSAGDYLLVVEDGAIESRWFIMDNYWNREKQVIITLRRDLVVDFYDEYKNEPFFCEKGMLLPTDNMIFNPENMSYNQVKSDVIELTDKTKSRWVILYVARNFRVEDEGVIYRLSSTGGIKLRNTRASQDYEGIYELWCFPYDSVKFKLQDGTIITCDNNSSATKGAIANLPGFIGDAYLYDYQLVPYCPFIDTRGWSVQNDSASIKTILCPANNNDFEVFTNTNGNIITNGGLVMIYSTSSEVSISMNPIYPYSTGNALEQTIDSECRFVRVCDTLETSVYEFNVAKNGGNFSFNIYARYKPYAPSIRIKPAFGGLYGINKPDDQRGVSTVVSYSLPQISNTWREYQIQNANYMNIFNRGIQNQEINRDVQLKQMQMAGTINAISTGLSAGGNTGYLAGQILGGGPGSLVGVGTGSVAGALSLAGASQDISAYNMLANEAIDYSKDLFGYQMGNIKALPTNLVSSGVFGARTHKFPFIEIYTATQDEITALTNKIKYNGFSVGRIGTFSEFENNANSYSKYIKGQLVRCENIQEDFHLLSELGKELNKGVFV